MLLNSLSIIIPLNYIFAGMALLAFIVHGLIGLSSHKHSNVGQQNRYFSTLCLLALGFYVFNGQVLSAPTIDDVNTPLLLLRSFADIFFMFYPFYFAAYFHRLKIFAWALVPVWVVIIVLNWVLPTGVTFESIQRINHIQLPWGENLTWPAGKLSVWIQLQTLASLIAVWGCFIYAMIANIKKHPQSRLLVTLASGLFAFALLNDSLIKLQLMSGVFITEYIFPFFILLMMRELFFQLWEVSELESKLVIYRDRYLNAEKLERERIADLLHDGPIQSLSLARLQLGVPSSLGLAPDQIISLAIGDIRKAVDNLNPKMLLQETLENLLSTIALKTSKELAVSCQYISNGISTERVSIDIKGIVVDCVNELIRNVIRHAEASNITIESRWSNDMLIVSVTDDGQGIPEDKLRTEHYKWFGYGLWRIDTRLKAENGSMHIENNTKGTRITLSIPCKIKDEHN